MATIQALSLTAPDVTNLIADGNRTAPGVWLSWDIPASEQLFGTEIWRSNTNDRGSATRIAVVVGANHYTDIIYPNLPKYYWIRGINMYGRSTGAWYPSSATAGITGIDQLPYHTSSVYSRTSDATWQTVCVIDVYNTTLLPITGTIMFSCSLNCAAGESTQFKVIVAGDVSLSNYSYPATIGTVGTPVVAFPISISSNPIFYHATYTIQFLGPAGGLATVDHCAFLYNWDYIYAL